MREVFFCGRIKTMVKPKINASIVWRLFISLTAAALPVIFLLKGIYGSFIFTFSIPLLWQVGFLGKPINSLGLRAKSLNSSIIIGIATGCLLGFIGGNILKFSGIAGYNYSALHKLQFTLGSLHIDFPLGKELGYRLLTASNNFSGLCLYFIFSIFVIGLGEELLWRGFIQKKISFYFTQGMSIWITAILFALIHFYLFALLPVKTGICFLVLIAISGAVWGYLFAHFHNLWIAAISHGISAFIIWKYYFFSSLARHPGV